MLQFQELIDDVKRRFTTPGIIQECSKVHRRMYFVLWSLSLSCSLFQKNLSPNPLPVIFLKFLQGAASDFLLLLNPRNQCKMLHTSNYFFESPGEGYGQALTYRSTNYFLINHFLFISYLFVLELIQYDYCIKYYMDFLLKLYVKEDYII